MRQFEQVKVSNQNGFWPIFDQNLQVLFVIYTANDENEH